MRAPHHSVAEALGTQALDNAAPTVTHFEAWDMPRGNVVYEFPSRRVEAEFATIAEAHTHADQLNKWLLSRPTPDRRYRMFVPPPEPTEAALFALIDRLHEPEERLAAISVAHLERIVELESTTERSTDD